MDIDTFNPLILKYINYLYNIMQKKAGLYLLFASKDQESVDLLATFDTYDQAYEYVKSCCVSELVPSTQYLHEFHGEFMQYSLLNGYNHVKIFRFLHDYNSQFATHVEYNPLPKVKEVSNPINNEYLQKTYEQYCKQYTTISSN